MKWLPALQQEQRVAEILFKQKQRGFCFNAEDAKSKVLFFENRMRELEGLIIPLLPLQVKKITTIDKPYKLNGELTARVIKYGFDAGENIGGPFSIIKFERVNLGSEAQVKRALTEMGWKPREWNMKKVDGRWKKTSPKLTEDSLSSLVAIGEDKAKLFHEYMMCKHRLGLVKGWLKIVRDDGRVEAGYSGYADTYRLRHRDIVNVPRPSSTHGDKLRELFTAGEGYKLIGIDADQCQLRGLAHYMNDEEYTKRLLFGDKEKGTDAHSYVQKISGAKDRTQGKILQYAIVFGASPAKIAEILETNSSRGKEIIAKVMEGLPGLRRVKLGMENALKQRTGIYKPRMFKRQGYLLGLDRRPVFINSPHKCLVNMLQALETLVMKIAMIKLADFIEENGYDAHFVAFMHDEFQIEAREDCCEVVAKKGAECITLAGEELKLRCPQEGDYIIGNNWKETH